MLKLFSLMKFHVFVFAFIAFAFGVILKKKIIAKTNVRELTAYVFFYEF